MINTPRIQLLTCACLIPTLGFAQSESNSSAQVTSEAADSRAEQVTEIASITTDRGIVTRPGRLTIEPAFSHAHSNSTRVAIEGYTVIPALLVGLINISEIQRDIFVTSLTLKYGITSRLETDIRIPWLRISEDLRERQAFEGTPVDTLRESSGEGLGDVELSARYQLNDGLDGWPYVIGVFRVKAPTGDSPMMWIGAWWRTVKVIRSAPNWNNGQQAPASGHSNPGSRLSIPPIQPCCSAASVMYGQRRKIRALIMVAGLILAM